ncbi:hypothetical protein [Streptosporangium sp. NPDC051022]|uniref:hypothetical protein n=1 Tax=Streptosporangium sp. NPDC051022 TaxID=3155752 RepID=UPI003431E10D
MKRVLPAVAAVLGSAAFACATTTPAHAVESGFVYLQSGERKTLESPEERRCYDLTGEQGEGFKPVYNGAVVTAILYSDATCHRPFVFLSPGPAFDLPPFAHSVRFDPDV